ncbi:MAG: cobalamin-dependent protein [Sterolibacterium sp.]|nr:cobalamin-dependent protein [Sterolibacterium sp.]MBP9798930.1 cobalamin-dependent protein [Sterolibacterium sp.]
MKLQPQLQPQPQHSGRRRGRIRIVTATALFDGHDAAINIMRRILQASGAEVIHLGHHRSVEEIVEAALQEDADAVAVSSYQGGHVEFFRYMVDLLRARGGADIQIFGGGGGVIVPHEIEMLHASGVTHIYSVTDGQMLGLQGMADDLLSRVVAQRSLRSELTMADVQRLVQGDRQALGRFITALEDGCCPHAVREQLHCQVATAGRSVPVVGITGTGGAGKSSLTDELIRRFRLDQEDRLRLVVLSIDPSRRRTGGALLGDRIRMNAIDHPNIMMRSLATRDSGSELCAVLPEVIAACRLTGFDLILVETAGIGQGDAAIAPLVDVALYVMTPEFGAASQLEKIDMLDYADIVVINKFDRKGAEDALRDVCKQFQRNHGRFAESPETLPVFGTVAARFNDDGVTACYQALRQQLAAAGLVLAAGGLPVVHVRHSSHLQAVVPAGRVRYLAEIADAVRSHHRRVEVQVALARECQALRVTQALLATAGRPVDEVAALCAFKEAQRSEEARRLLVQWPQVRAAYSCTEEQGACSPLFCETLSGLRLPRVALPDDAADVDEGTLLRFLMRENLPGAYPYTAGVFAFKRADEEPTRMFAGEGDAFRTNQRFHALSAGMPARRLSTAFDSVTLYGSDPEVRPDIYGKIGNAGVSIATLDDLRELYAWFDLCDPAVSVSMTINGPAPVLLAMYFNVALDQQVENFRAAQGRAPDSGEWQAIRQRVLHAVRGTVQADILKEDQGQNTCIFSTEFALRMMGDVQEWFIHHEVRHFYAVSVSGYHIAEAGANPVTQLAFTLANGFTYVEACLARGLRIDDFAPSLSFFFSNGMEPEYAVIGRVARRIWAVAMKERYGANERSQKLKYHIQTSGRSLHAQEMAFNDIRTTLQALIASYDHCNSLHTNAYDEAITTPTEDSVRRALAIQLIINREWGLSKNQNPNQGSFIIETLTDLVEEAVLREFDALTARGGVLGAMETGYQRSRIQEESLHYERLKHDGSLPVVGVNTFLKAQGISPAVSAGMVLARSSEAEKQSQLQRLQTFHERHQAEVARCLVQLKQAALNGGNVFEVLMEAVRHCSLGQITAALHEVGGQYRRGM